MILIAESSSSATEWCLVENDVMIEHYVTEGINPFFQTRKDISRLIRLNLPEVFFKSKVTAIYYYGAGCLTPEKKNIVKASLETQIKARTQVESDVFGAARAMFQHQSGIACMLDIDSSSCFYNGEKIEKRVRPLGYILGDEGSSAVLGKLFVADCLKKLAPEMIMKSFYERYGITADRIIDMIYTQPFPNRRLSEMSFFLSEHIYHPYVHNLVYMNLKSFFTRNVLQFDHTNYPIRIAGRVANTYSELIMQIADEMRLRIDMIVKSPIQGLIQYHSGGTRL
ncbi:MAG: hypothetical protein QM751_08375 [Paludibacteraceae bacterium]